MHVMQLVLFSFCAVRSTGSDSVFDDKSGIRSWRKRTSMSCATESIDSQSECDEVMSISLPCFRVLFKKISPVFSCFYLQLLELLE